MSDIPVEIPNNPIKLLEAMHERASGDEKDKLKEIIDGVMELYYAAGRIVHEFHEWGEVLQVGEGDDYNDTSAVGELQLTLEKFGDTFSHPVSIHGEDE